MGFVEPASRGTCRQLELARIRVNSAILFSRLTRRKILLLSMILLHNVVFIDSQRGAGNLPTRKWIFFFFALRINLCARETAFGFAFPKLVKFEGSI